MRAAGVFSVSTGKFVGLSVVLFMIAVGFVVVAQGPEWGALIDAFRAEPLTHKIAWAVAVLVPLAMLPFAIWVWDTLVRQRHASGVLELRLDGVRQVVREAAKAQGEAETELRRLARSEPEGAIDALQQRLDDAERLAHVQQLRNESIDLKSRIDGIRAHQEALKERLRPVLEARRAIEQLFLDLDTRQHDLERALTEIASGDDAVALEVRLKNLGEFVRQGNQRCDQIDQASTTIATLKGACAELAARVQPFAAAEDGITARVRELAASRDRLTTELDALEHGGDGDLVDHLRKLGEDKNQLGDRIGRLNAQFAELVTLRKDAAALFAGFERALDVLALPKDADGAQSTDARVGELARFIKETQGQLGEIEQRVVVFNELKTRLGELQGRLVPLEAEDGGVLKLIDELQQMRERLIAKIRTIEGGEEGDLAARVRQFAQSKGEIEQRVTALSEQFTKLATVRNDISGLFEKLSSAINASSR